MRNLPRLIWQAIAGPWHQPPTNTAATRLAPIDANMNMVAEPVSLQRPASTAYDAELLDRMRMQWQFGEWHKLCEVSVAHIENHPERAKIALIVATAFQQRGDSVNGRRFVEYARQWGCDRKLVAQMLIAGVHNTLGRVATIMGEQRAAGEHFQQAVIGLSGEPALAAQVRTLSEMSRMGLLNTSSTFGQVPGTLIRDEGDRQPITRRHGKAFAGSSRIASAEPVLTDDQHPMEHDRHGAPIFIHSLWRSGSTYLFQVFRRTSGYWAYQEPLHETVLPACKDPAVLESFTSDNYKWLRHPALDKQYYYELRQTHDAWHKKLFKKMILDDYFVDTDTDTIDYFSALIQAARGRPVIQECRTSGRIASIRRAIGGVHIYLWRNPWDQWWSFKVDAYFNTVCQIIIGAPNAPPAILFLREEIGYRPFHAEDMGAEIYHFQARPLSSEQGYLVFYMLWCLALLNGSAAADLLINVDKLSFSKRYRNETLATMVSLGLSDLTFDDCLIPQAFFARADLDFFQRQESRVHALLRESGSSQADIELIRKLQLEFAPPRYAENVQTLQRDLIHARQAVSQLEATAAQLGARFSGEI
jgi:hypothetical protein